MKHTKSLFILLPAAAVLSFVSPVTLPAQANGNSPHINMHYMVNEHNMTQIHLQKFKDNRDNWSFQSRQDDQSQLKDLLRQHAVVGGITFIKIHDNSPDVDSYRQKVDDNTKRLTDMIGRMKGDDRKEEFRTLWQSHIDMLTAYTIAKRDNNSNNQQNALMNIDDTTNKLAVFFGKDNASIDTLRNMFKTHINQEKEIIDSHDLGDDEHMRQMLKEADMHAAMMADELAGLYSMQKQDSHQNMTDNSNRHNDGDHDQDYD